jgi:hypothetical protein
LVPKLVPISILAHLFCTPIFTSLAFRDEENSNIRGHFAFVVLAKDTKIECGVGRPPMHRGEGVGFPQSPKISRSQHIAAEQSQNWKIEYLTYIFICRRNID